jgi:PAS domain S-box-containing protein
MELILSKLVAAIISVALGAGILARDHGLRANRLLAAFLFCNAWWAGGEFLTYQQTDPEVVASIYRWMCLGWIPLGVLCMHASLTLSAMEEHPVARLIPILYLALVVILPIAVTTDFVIAGAEVISFGWRPTFNGGLWLAYGLVATPVIAILVSWRGLMTLSETGGQLQLARIAFFGISGSFVAGTLTSIVLPLLDIEVFGFTTALIALVGVAVTVTLHRYGHSLISPQAFAREILDTLEDGVVMIGPGGVLRDANRAFLRMIGSRGQSVVGRPIRDWIKDFPIQSSSAESSTFMEVRTRSGETIPVVVSAPVACNESGARGGQAFLLRDRREIVSLQRRLVVSARLAAVGDLSKSISRSIIEPVVRTRAELAGLSIDWQALDDLLERAPLRASCREAMDEGRELIAECQEGVERIFSIVSEVGSFSARSPNSDLDEHSLDEIVMRALRVARAHAPAWVEIEARLDSDVQIHCHASEIERVVANLLVNSIQSFEAKPRSGAHLVVGVAARSGRALLHVEDDGCGIESDALDRIFDPFFTTKPVGKGTGLGLAISYHIVKAHGGEIRVSSMIGRGTSVTVDLPIASIEAADRASKAGQRKKG